MKNINFFLFRTGRFGKPGIAINLVDSDSSMSIIQKFEHYFGFYKFFLFKKKIIFYRTQN